MSTAAEKAYTLDDLESDLHNLHYLIDTGVDIMVGIVREPDDDEQNRADALIWIARDLVRRLIENTTHNMNAVPAPPAGPSVADIQALIDAHKAAQQRHEAMSHTEMIKLNSLAAIDAALVAICAARPSAPEAIDRRRAYLMAELWFAIQNSPGMATRVFEALLK
jgi:hypothetical protein